MPASSSAGLSRRQVVAGTVGGAVAVAVGASAGGGATPTAPEASGPAPRRASPGRFPVVFLPHGGGPWPFVPLNFAAPGEASELSAYLRSLVGITPTPPRALLVISAHWEEPQPTVMSGTRPPMLYDYYGFPPESYQLTWPAAGDPALAARVEVLLQGAGFATGRDAARGFDHGTFVPLKVTWPDGQVPTVQLSLKAGLDPAEHLAMGRALEPLRDEGVLIVGSGMSYHNMRGFGGAGRAASETFDTWLQQAALAPAAERARQLTAWASAPAARASHPREEHLLPLMVIAGAAGDDAGRLAYNGTFSGVRLSAFHYG